MSKVIKTQLILASVEGGFSSLVYLEKILDYLKELKEKLKESSLRDCK